jgi:DNA-binding transcriptional MerR regulator
MSERPLRTMKEVAELLNRPAHRIIHVCETKLVLPAVDADGRGTVRRFSRDDVFRIRLALALQDIGVDLPEITPLMVALDQFLDIAETLNDTKWRLADFDLVSAIDHVKSTYKAMRAYLVLNERPRIFIPGFRVGFHHGHPLQLLAKDSAFDWPAVTIVVDLTLLTAEL